MNTRIKLITEWSKAYKVEVAKTGTVYFYTPKGCIRLSDHPQMKYRASRPIVLNLRWTDAAETMWARILELK